MNNGTVIGVLTHERAARRARFDWLDMPFGELLLSSMCHVQRHTGQLDLMLRRQTNPAPSWVRYAEPITDYGR